MSLLLDALKKAEQAKQKVAAPAEAIEKPVTADNTDSGAMEPHALEFTLEKPYSSLEAKGQAPENKSLEGAQNGLAFPGLTLTEPETPTESKPPLSGSKSEESADPPTIAAEPATLPIDDILPALTVLNEATIAVHAVWEEPPSPASAAPPASSKANSPPQTNTPISPETPRAASPSLPNTADSDKAAARQEAQRKTAKNVFSAKLSHPVISSKLLAATLAAGALSVTGLGFYYWMLLSEPQPQPFRRAHPLPATHQAPIQIAVTANSTTAPPLEQPRTGGIAPSQASAEMPKIAENQPRQPGATTTLAQVAESAPTFSTPADSAIRIRRTTHPDQVNPVLLRAFQAYEAGDIAQAEKDYRQMLRQDSRNRDALLGLAAIAAGQQRVEDAVSLYAHLLQLDPKDPAAQAGLIDLKGASDPLQSESRLKILLARHPETGFLHFALGNLYAQQARWPEAQGAYFNAFSAEPKNAGYAFNLAISLDHLNQGKLALKYYQQALALAGKQSAGFDKAQVSERVQALMQ